MRIDWQAYMDGSLSADEKAFADRMLAEQPEAKHELASLQAFRRQVRDAGRKEAVPHARLNAMLAATRPKPIRWQRVTFATAAAATLLLAGWFAFTRIPITAETSDPVQIQQIALEAGGAWVPRLNLTGMATLRGVEAAPGWTAVRIDSSAGAFRLEAHVDGACHRGLATVQAHGVAFYEDETALGWRCPQSYYVLTGGTKEERWRIAERICREMGLIRREA